MASQYRIEHVATVPTGYRVRTITRDGHRVRIAFPPTSSTRGRGKGSGQVVEVLHPKREANPCRLPNPFELVIMTANPSPSAESAGELYERFHGDTPAHVDEYHEPSPRPSTLTELGDLLEIRVKRIGGWKWGSLNFEGQGIKLASNASGRQLYLVGGDQKVSRGQITQIGGDNQKDLIDLGEACYIAYRTRKAQVGGAVASYEHQFGEVSGVRPRLMYDRRGPQPRIYFVGGEYRVEDVGIVN